jgi:hypothetical protein
MDNRRSTIVLALIVLICFFLPWVQVSCGASSSRLSAVDIARDGHNSLWLILPLMLAVLLVGVLRAWRERREISALASVLAGLITTYLMNRERLRAGDTSGLIAVRLTGWFWLGLVSSVGLVVLGSLRLLKRSRKTPQN